MNRISTKTFAASTAPLRKELLYRAAYQRVSEERQKKTDRYRLLADRRLSLGAELLLIQGLEWAGLPRTEINFHYNSHGKPYLAGENKIFFNLSHSGELVVCAVSSREIGCDVERMADRSFDIAKRFFCPEEYDRIVSQPTEKARQDMFYRLWTLKESLLKATGQGLCLPMNSFSIALETDLSAIRQTVKHQTYYLQELSLAENYKCSVCGLDPALEISPVPVEWVHFSEILTDS